SGWRNVRTPSGIEAVAFFVTCALLCLLNGVWTMAAIRDSRRSACRKGFRYGGCVAAAFLVALFTTLSAVGDVGIGRRHITASLFLSRQARALDTLTTIRAAESVYAERHDSSFTDDLAQLNEQRHTGPLTGWDFDFVYLFRME